MDRLATLQQLLLQGFISAQEYNVRKTQIIDALTNTRLDQEMSETPPTPIIPKTLSMEDDNVPQSTISRKVKYDLSRKIRKLSPSSLKYVLILVRKNSPHQLRKSEDEWTFDLDKLNDATISKLEEYVDNELQKDKDSAAKVDDTQGLMKQEMEMLAASVNTNYFEEPKTDGSQMEEDSVSAMVEDVIDAVDNDPNDPDYLFEQEPPTPGLKHKEFLQPNLKRKRVKTPSPIPQPVRKTIQKKRKRSEKLNLSKEMKTEDSSLIPHSPDIANEQKKGEPYKIEICIYTLGKQENGPKPYKCDGCDKTFSDRSNLVQHLRTHTKEKPFRCDFEGCNKAFAHSASLKEHRNKHLGIKPFVCNHEGCGKRFAQSSNLRRHKKIHTGEKPFVCSHPGCGKRFSQKSNLKVHEKRPHDKMKKRGARSKR